MAAAFERALRARPDAVHQAHYRFGGRPVRLRVVGGLLAQLLGRPFAHLVADPPPADLPAARVSKIAAELLHRPEPPPDPAIPLFSGVYTFPWYLSTLKAWIWLTLGGLAIGVGVQTTLN